MDATRRPRPTGDFEIRRVDDRVLVHDEAHGKVHVMNASAAGVLSLCDGARTVGDIVRELAAQHGIDELRASSDAAQILNSFVELRLIALE